jgi:SNF2 family DNA or RNA helicase
MPAQNLDELSELKGFRVLDRVALRQKNGIGTWEITDDMMESWFIKRPDLKEKITEVVKKARQIMRFVKMRGKDSFPPKKFPISLRPYQDEYNKKFFGINAGMFFEPGLGKTWTMIASLMMQGASIVVIVAPGELVCQQWSDEIREYWRKDVVLALGSTAEKIEAIRSGNGVIVTNYHAFLQDEVCEAIANIFPQWLILDESHNIKNVAPLSKTKFKKGQLHKSIAKNILSLSHYIPKRQILTGTPITKVKNYEVESKSGNMERYAPQGISEDLFSQFYFLDHGETFGANLYQFKMDWIEEFRLSQKNRRYAPRDREKLEAEFVELCRGRSMVVRAKDVLSMDLPNIIIKKIPVDYNFEKRMLEIKEGMVIPELNQEIYFLALIRRMLQLCGGHDFGAEVFHNFKIKATMEILEESEEPTVIFCSHLQEIIELQKELKKRNISFSTISGSVKDKKTEKENFLSGESQIIIIQMKAGGVGLDGLQHVCSRIIYYNIDYGWVYYEQSYKRVLRSGQKNVVTIYRLVCEGNYIDSAVYASIDAQDDAIVRRFLEKL